MKKIRISEETIRNAVMDEIKKVVTDNLRRDDSMATSPKQDVMRRFYGVESNGHKPMLIEHITIDRIMKKHGGNGFVILSANRSDMSQEENDENTRSLIGDIRKTGLSYLPTYGGYRSTEGVEDDYEPSFIVFNYNGSGNVRDFGKLRDFAIEMCGKYNQDSVLVKSPENPPIYVDRNGKKVSKKESNDYWKNDSTKNYFTSLKPKDGIIGRRFTMDISFDDDEVSEVYVNPHPCTLNERMRRGKEVMLF